MNETLIPIFLADIHSVITQGVASAASTPARYQAVMQSVASVVGGIIAIAGTGFTLINGAKSFTKSNQNGLEEVVEGFKAAYEMEKIRREQSEEIRKDLTISQTDLRASVSHLKKSLASANVEIADMRKRLDAISVASTADSGKEKD